MYPKNPGQPHLTTEKDLLEKIGVESGDEHPAAHTYPFSRHRDGFQER
jgi:hypothetical protein